MRVRSVGCAVRGLGLCKNLGVRDLCMNLGIRDLCTNLGVRNLCMSWVVGDLCENIGVKAVKNIGVQAGLTSAGPGGSVQGFRVLWFGVCD